MPDTQIPGSSFRGAPTGVPVAQGREGAGKNSPSTSGFNTNPQKLPELTPEHPSGAGHPHQAVTRKHSSTCSPN